MQNRSHENEFGLHGNESVGGIHFHMNGFVTGCKRQRGNSLCALDPLSSAEAQRFFFGWGGSAE